MRYLLGRRLPNAIRLQTQRLKESAAIKHIKPILNKILGGSEAAAMRDSELMIGKVSSGSPAETWSDLQQVIEGGSSFEIGHFLWT